MARVNGKIDRIAGLIIGAIVFPVVSVVTWWALDNDPAIVFGEATLIPDSVAPGGRVMTYYQVNVKRNCPLDIGRGTRDASKIDWPATTVRINQINLGPGSINLAMVIPTDAAAGSADMTNTYRAVCNPWQALFAPWHDMPPLSVTVARP